MNIDTLVTTCNKTKSEILQMISENALQGNIIVGNQCGVDGLVMISGTNYTLKIINSNAVGVSNNRNRLLLESRADYVTFADDDIHFCLNYLSLVSTRLKEKKFPEAIRFNCKSLNAARPITQEEKSHKITSFSEIKEYGVCGSFFNRQFLLKNSLFFPIDMGPGTPNKCGEDTFFLNRFLKKRPEYYFFGEEICFTPQSSSSWYSKDDSNLLVSEGYAYRRTFGQLVCLFAGIYHVLKHRSRFPETPINKQLKLFILGSKKATESKKQKVN